MVDSYISLYFLYHEQIVLQKVGVLSTFYNSFSQPATTWFAARLVYVNVGRETSSIAFQLVLGQLILQYKLHVFFAHFSTVHLL